MSPVSKHGSIYRFGVFEFDPSGGLLSKNGIRLRIQHQPLTVLLALVERPGELVTREELRERLWSAGTFVDFEQGLNAAITRLRHVLGDSADSSRFIATEARAGYRFVAPVQTVTPTAGKAGGEGFEPTPGSVPGLEVPLRHDRVRGFPWGGPLAVLFAAIAAGVSLLHFFEQRPASPVLAMSINPPEGAAFNETAISPNGELLAFTATSNGMRHLWVRPLRSLTAERLPWTEGAKYPFWSPDSRWIGFGSPGALKKIKASGGPAQTLCKTPVFRGGTWNQHGVILFAGPGAGMSRVGEQGGNAAEINLEKPARLGEVHAWPVFLPDGDHYLYSLRSPDAHRGIYLASLRGGPATHLTADAAGQTADDLVLSLHEGTLLAQKLDIGRLALSGNSFSIAKGVLSNPIDGRGGYSVSSNNILVYATAPEQIQFEWVERSGAKLTRLAVAGQTTGIDPQPRLSPDEQQVAVVVQGSIWLHHFTGGVSTRLTFDPGRQVAPVWSPDGKRIAFANWLPDGSFDLYQKQVDGTAPEELLVRTENPKHPMGWSPDGRFLLYHERSRDGNFDLWVLPLEGDRKPVAFLRSEFNEREGTFSPDGRWIAYSSDESGTQQVYVQPYPATGSKWLVSTTGGSWPRWRGDGNELFFLEPGGALVAVAVSAGSTFQAGVSTKLFMTGISNPVAHFGAARDGKRFLLPVQGESAATQPLTAVWNWQASVRR